MKPPSDRIPIDVAELEQLLDQPILSDEDRNKLRAALHLLGALQCELESDDAKLRRLRRVAFGASTEKTRQVCGERDGAAPADPAAQTDEAAKSKPKREGHGRNGALRYRGAKRHRVSHASLHPGDGCPDCTHGTL